ncbi:Condensin complex subunit 2 [Nakaseomyces bracarensis]|uniref:Condensin complex subunit 2 n=1 Tax=Nakaseomyces bracarensis TaxID=273131 RepID=A0ABR4NZ28_9SACH
MSQLEDEGLFTNRSTVLANFEEWIKMATDNKINSRNSWNFALIDYFYDLNVLRDSENNINFQKASATLDGCVKIYSSRVDSVTSETGKLLSGLSQRKANEGKGTYEAGTDAEGGNEAGNDSVEIDPLTGLPVGNGSDEYLRKRRVHNRVLETTLVEFDTIRMKELDQELSIDPLFKKALVDFDEGGAKSLLLNTLSVDETGRVVFDASMNNSSENKPLDTISEKDETVDQRDSEVAESNEAGDVTRETEINSETSRLTNSIIEEDSKADLTLNKSFSNNFQYSMDDEVLGLGIEFIKFDDIAVSDISPSLKNLRNVVADINQAKGFIDSVNNKFDNFLTEEELKEAIPENDDGGIKDFDTGINEELEYSIHHEMDDNLSVNDNVFDDNNGNEDSLSDDDADDNIDSIMGSIMEQDLMAYFDEKMNKNWRGREHWKVSNYKKVNAVDNKTSSTENKPAPSGTGDDGKKNQADSKKDKKKAFEVNFLEMDPEIEDKVFESKKRTAIDMPQKSRFDDTHYLLPNDYHFSTAKITSLFIKPDAKMSIFKKKVRSKKSEIISPTSGENDLDNVPEIADEQFWADNYERQENEANGNDDEPEDSRIIGAAVENPFEDDGIDFNQAFEENSIGEESDKGLFPQTQEDMLKLHQPEAKVNYSRVSKKVDVRRLKKNIWLSVKSVVADKTEASETVITFTFTDITKNLSKFYSPDTLKDLSTSFCFICLLHLANEHGLQIKSTPDYQDLEVIYDTSLVEA